MSAFIKEYFKEEDDDEEDKKTSTIEIIGYVLGTILFIVFVVLYQYNYDLVMKKYSRNASPKSPIGTPRANPIKTNIHYYNQPGNNGNNRKRRLGEISINFNNNASKNNRKAYKPSQSNQLSRYTRFVN